MNMILRRQHDGGNSDELHDLFGENAFCVDVGFFPELLVETKKIRAASYITLGAPSFWSKQILRRRWIFPGV